MLLKNANMIGTFYIIKMQVKDYEKETKSVSNPGGNFNPVRNPLCQADTQR